MVPAPLTRDPETARRIDLGHRYVAHGRLRPGLELLSSSEVDDEIVHALVDLVSARLTGHAGPEANAALPILAIAVHNADPLCEQWAIAPQSAITAVSRREPNDA